MKRSLKTTLAVLASSLAATVAMLGPAAQPASAIPTIPGIPSPVYAKVLKYDKSSDVYVAHKDARHTAKVDIGNAQIVFKHSVIGIASLSGTIVIDDLVKASTAAQIFTVGFDTTEGHFQARFSNWDANDGSYQIQKLDAGGRVTEVTCGGNDAGILTFNRANNYVKFSTPGACFGSPREVKVNNVIVESFTHAPTHDAYDTLAIDTVLG